MTRLLTDEEVLGGHQAKQRPQQSRRDRKPLLLSDADVGIAKPQQPATVADDAAGPAAGAEQPPQQPTGQSPASQQRGGSAFLAQVRETVRDYRERIDETHGEGPERARQFRGAQERQRREHDDRVMTSVLPTGDGQGGRQKRADAPPVLPEDEASKAAEQATKLTQQMRELELLMAAQERGLDTSIVRPGRREPAPLVAQVPGMPQRTRQLEPDRVEQMTPDELEEAITEHDRQQRVGEMGWLDYGMHLVGAAAEAPATMTSRLAETAAELSAHSPLPSPELTATLDLLAWSLGSGGRAIEAELIQPDMGREFLSEVASTIGSASEFLLAGGAVRQAVQGGARQLAATGGYAAAASFAEYYDTLRTKHGLDDETALTVAMLESGTNVIDVLPVLGAFRRASRAVPQSEQNRLRQMAVGYLTNAAWTAGEESIVNTAGEYVRHQIARDWIGYDPDAEEPDWGKLIALSGVMGAFTSGVTTATAAMGDRVQRQGLEQANAAVMDEWRGMRDKAIAALPAADRARFVELTDRLAAGEELTTEQMHEARALAGRADTARRQPERKQAEPAAGTKGELLTPEGARRFAEQRPDLAFRLAGKQRPSRRDVEGIAGSDRWSAQERHQLASLLRNEVDESTVKLVELGFTVAEVQRMSAEDVQAAMDRANVGTDVPAPTPDRRLSDGTPVFESEAVARRWAEAEKGRLPEGTVETHIEPVGPRGSDTSAFVVRVEKLTPGRDTKHETAERARQDADFDALQRETGQTPAQIAERIEALAAMTWDALKTEAKQFGVRIAGRKRITIERDLAEAAPDRNEVDPEFASGETRVGDAHAADVPASGEAAAAAQTAKAQAAPDLATLTRDELRAEAKRMGVRWTTGSSRAVLEKRLRETRDKAGPGGDQAAQPVADLAGVTWDALEGEARRVGVRIGGLSRKAAEKRVREARGEAAATTTAGEARAPVTIDSSPLGIQGLTGKRLRDRLWEFARTHLLGQRVTNHHSGRGIQIGRSGVKKGISSSYADPKRAGVLAGLKGLLESATHVGTESPRNKPQNVKAFHRFEADAVLDGEPLSVGLTVREENNGNWYYNHDIDPPQIKSDPPQRPGVETAPAVGESQGVPQNSPRRQGGVAQEPVIPQESPRADEAPAGELGGRAEARRPTQPTTGAAQTSIDTSQRRVKDKTRPTGRELLATEVRTDTAASNQTDAQTPTPDAGPSAISTSDLVAEGRRLGVPVRGLRREVAEQRVRKAREASERTADLRPGKEAMADTATETSTVATNLPAMREGHAADSVQPDDIRRSDTIQRISEALGVPTRTGRWNILKRRALGAYAVRPEVIRLRSPSDVRTAAHEIGHHLHKLMFGTTGKGGLNEAPLRPYRAELVGLTHEAGFPESSRTLREGLAELVARYVTDPASLDKLAPRATAHVEHVLSTDHAEVRDLLHDARTRWEAWEQAPARGRLRAQITSNRNPLRWNIRDIWRRFRFEVLDDLDPIRRFSDTFDQPHSVRRRVEGLLEVQARTARASAGTAETFLSIGALDFNSMDVIGPSLDAVMKPVASNKPDYLAFQDYAIARRVDELAGRGISTGISARDARQIINQLETTERQQAFEQLQEWNRHLLAYIRDAGVISQQTYENITENNKAYMPFYRAMDDARMTPGPGRDFQHLFSPVKRIKGSERDIIDPFESMLKNAYTYVALAHRQEVHDSIFRLAGEEGAGRFLHKIDPPTDALKVTREEVMQWLHEQGAQLVEGDAPMDAMEEMMVAFRPGNYFGKENVISRLLPDGRRQWYEVADVDLARALTTLRRPQLGTLMRIVSMPARWLRAGATGTPDFAVRNLFRDQVWSPVLSENVNVPFEHATRGMIAAWHHVRGDRDALQKWKSAGGEFAALVDMDRGWRRDTLKSMLTSKVPNVVTNPLRLLWTISRGSENASRLGEFDKARQRLEREGYSGRELQQRAALAAREVGTDYMRRGANPAIQAVRMIATFWNPRIQSWDRLARAYRRKPAATTLKALTWITLPSVLLWYVNKDDEEYQEMPQWQKDLFWLVKVPRSWTNWMPDFLTAEVEGSGAGRAAVDRALLQRVQPLADRQDDHVWLRIPKPFQLGLIFGSVPERMLDWAYTKDRSGVDASMRQLLGVDVSRESATLSDRLTDFTTSEAGAIITPDVQAVTPFLENWANWSRFRQRPIVPRSQQDLLPAHQFGDYTSEVAKMLGATLDYSPAKIQNVIESWTGGMGRYALDASDWAITHAGGVQPHERPTRGWPDWPVLRSFTARSPGFSSASIETFYREYQAGASAHRTGNRVRRDDPDRYEPFAHQNERHLAAYQLLRPFKQTLDSLRDEARSVATDGDIDGREKQRRIDALGREAMQTAREALDHVDKATTDADGLRQARRERDAILHMSVLSRAHPTDPEREAAWEQNVAEARAWLRRLDMDREQLGQLYADHLLQRGWRPETRQQHLDRLRGQWAEVER